MQKGWITNQKEETQQESITDIIVNKEKDRNLETLHKRDKTLQLIIMYI